MTQRTKAWRCAGHGPVAGVVLVVLLLPLNGCVPEARSSEAIHQYQRASEELGEAASALFVHANSVEAETYIDTQDVFTESAFGAGGARPRGSFE